MLIFKKEVSRLKEKKLNLTHFRLPGISYVPDIQPSLSLRKVLRQQASLIYLAFWDCLASSLLPPDIVSIHLIFSNTDLLCVPVNLQVAQTGNWYLIHSWDSQCKITGSVHQHLVGNLKDL